MSLKGIRVLLDGYNLELSQGTGISTYSLTLVEALRQLKADVNVLCSGWGSKDPALTEALLLDRLRQEPRGLQPSHLAGFAKALLGMGYRPQQVQWRGLVQNVNLSPFFGSVAQSVGIFTLGDCFQIASHLVSLTGKGTVLENPGNIDVWHATSPIPIKVKRTKKITTIHDIIPLRLPHMTFDKKKAFHASVRECLKESDLILCASESAKNDVLSFFDAKPEKIEVVYQPIALTPRRPDESTVNETMRKYQLKSKHFVLYVGSLEPRKNVVGLARVFENIGMDVPLVIVGKPIKKWEKEVAPIYQIQNVKVLHYVESEDLRSLYTAASCFVFPSFYEGFGLPPLEAMTFGCPVITSQVSSLPEVCGEAAMYIDPTDIGDMRDKVVRLVSDESLQRQLSQAGLSRAKLFSMDTYIPKIASAYQRVIA